MKRLILNPDEWPVWPFLPVKRKDSSLENKNLGFLVDEHKKDGKLTVYHGMLFNTPMKLKELPKSTYDDVDALLADGWVID